MIPAHAALPSPAILVRLTAVAKRRPLVVQEVPEAGEDPVLVAYVPHEPGGEEVEKLGRLDGVPLDQGQLGVCDVAGELLVPELVAILVAGVELPEIVLLVGEVQMEA